MEYSGQVLSFKNASGLEKISCKCESWIELAYDLVWWWNWH